MALTIRKLLAEHDGTLLLPTDVEQGNFDNDFVERVLMERFGGIVLKGLEWAGDPWERCRAGWIGTSLVILADRERKDFVLGWYGTTPFGSLDSKIEARGQFAGILQEAHLWARRCARLRKGVEDYHARRKSEENRGPMLDP